MATTNGRTTVRTQTQSVEGTVEGRNANGLKIGGAWINVSRYGKPVELPEVGAHVRVQVDDRGYIKSLDVLEATPVTGVIGATRDRTITRLTLIKAAATFAATRTDIKSGDVVTIAKSWERWVLES